MLPGRDPIALKNSSTWVQSRMSTHIALERVEYLASIVDRAVWTWDFQSRGHPLSMIM